MSLVLRTRTALRYAGSFILHFAHGGLVVIGGLAVTVLMMGLARPAGVLEPLSDPLAHLVPQLFSGDTDSVGTDSGIALSPDQKKLADYISRRYRVAMPAVEQLVSEAYTVAAQQQIEPLLLLAVISVESGFNPIAESVFGAQGLMQVIPKFHPEKLASEGDNATLLDPLVNIRVGAQVIKEYTKSEGSLQAGLQKYAGASYDPYAGYTAKVFSERQRLYQVLGRRVPEPSAVVVAHAPTEAGEATTVAASMSTTLAKTTATQAD